MIEPPGHLPESVQRIWLEVVTAYGPGWEAIAGPALDAYCGQVATVREAQRRLATEGLVIEDPRGNPIPHPALAIERTAQDEVRKWAPKFAPPRPRLARRRGPMYDATRASVAAAPHLKDKREFKGAIEAVCTLAWLIDEAQREGIDTLQKAAFGTIPSYLKGCAELQITPAAVPATKPAAPSTSKVSMIGAFSPPAATA